MTNWPVGLQIMGQNRNITFFLNPAKCHKSQTSLDTEKMKRLLKTRN